MSDAKRNRSNRRGRATSTPASAEDALQRAHKELKATWDALPDLVFEVDRDGRIHNYHATHSELLLADPIAIIRGAVAETAAKDRKEACSFPERKDR